MASTRRPPEAPAFQTKASLFGLAATSVAHHAADFRTTNANVLQQPMLQRLQLAFGAPKAHLLGQRRNGAFEGREQRTPNDSMTASGAQLRKRPQPVDGPNEESEHAVSLLRQPRLCQITTQRPQLPGEVLKARAHSSTLLLRPA